MEHGPCHNDERGWRTIGKAHYERCWGYIKPAMQDRDGEDICECDRCGQLFYTKWVNHGGVDVPSLRELDSDPFHADE